MSSAPYKKLFTYWFSVIIYDLTVEFCKRFLLSSLGNLSNLGGAPDRRTADQMIQAGRSGKANIAEGSEALKTSLKMGIKLTNTAKASEEELLGDYEDFLRQRGLEIWNKNDPRVMMYRRKAAGLVRNLSNRSNLRSERESTKLIREEFSLPDDPEEAANLILTLCHQITYLLNRQVEALEKKHEREGGYTEKLYTKRLRFRETSRKQPK